MEKDKQFVPAEKAMDWFINELKHQENCKKFWKEIDENMYKRREERKNEYKQSV